MFSAAALLILYAAGVSGFLAWNLRRTLDRRLLADLSAAGQNLRFQPDGALRLAAEPDPGLLLEVRAPDGGILYRSPSLGSRVVAGPPFAGEGNHGDLRSDQLHDGERIRLASRRLAIEGRTVLIRAARSERAARREWKDLSAALLYALPPALILAALAGYRLARFL